MEMTPSWLDDAVENPLDALETMSPDRFLALAEVVKAVRAHLAAPTVSSGHEVGIALARLDEEQKA